MRLPASVEEIAGVIGRDAALYLIGQLPRCHAGIVSGKGSMKSTRVILYVPKRLKPNHRLVEILGWERAAKLVEGFGGEILQPANCMEAVYQPFRDREARRMAADGVKPAELAEMFAVSERHIRSLCREIPQEELRPANDNTARD